MKTKEQVEKESREELNYIVEKIEEIEHDIRLVNFGIPLGVSTESDLQKLINEKEILENISNKLTIIYTKVVAPTSYEYEMLIDHEETPFEINTWVPITKDRIKDPSRIDEHITKGLIRKIL